MSSSSTFSRNPLITTKSKDSLHLTEILERQELVGKPLKFALLNQTDLGEDDRSRILSSRSFAFNSLIAPGTRTFQSVGRKWQQRLDKTEVGKSYDKEIVGFAPLGKDGRVR